MMIGKRYRSAPGWAATQLVLGMLCLRALVPAGFMLAPVDGRLGWVLCAPEVMAGGHYSHSRHVHVGHQGGHAAQACPYAQSAGSAPLTALPVLAGGSTVDRWVSPTLVAQTYLRFGPPRQHTSRGPPQFS